MLHNIYAPTDFVSRNLAPDIRPEDKLCVIANSPINVIPLQVKGRIYENSFTLKLPYTDGAVFNFDFSERKELLFTDHISVGDEDLYGHGIGSRFLRAACRYAVAKDQRINTFSTGWARLGLLNTAIKVFGEENVAIGHTKRYGWGGELPLDGIFEAKSPQEGRVYVVGSIEARIDRDLALSWEEPVYTLSEPGPIIS